MMINTKPVIVSLIITFTLVITLFPHSVMAADDHPEWPNATSVSIPSTTSGTIDPQGDFDWFKFPAQGGSNYRALIVFGTLNTGYVRVHRQNGATIGSNGSGDFSWIAPATEDNYVEVWGGQHVGSYQLELTSSVGAASMELVLHSVSDTSGTKHTSNPGTAKSTFAPGETVRVTLRARNNGPSSLGANWVLNLAPASNHNDVRYNSDPVANNTNDKTINNNGSWHYYSFDWTISSGTPTGAYDLIGAVRNSSNWNDVLDDTADGANTKLLGPSSWKSAFAITVRPPTTTPPTTTPPDWFTLTTTNIGNGSIRLEPSGVDRQR